MRTILLIVGIIIILILGKVFFFNKPETDKGFGGGGAPGGGKGGKGGGATPSIPVNVYLAKLEKIDNVVYSSGTVLPNEQVDMKAEASGRLIKLNLNEGSFVAKGQLIAKIKDTDLLAQLQKLQYNEQLAKQIEARQKKLLDINAISKEEYEISLNNISTIGADEDLVKAQIEKTEIRAPFAGKIGLKYISEGAFLAPGTSVVTLVQINPVKIDFTIPEKYSKNIVAGSSINFSVEGDNTNYSAKVVAIDPQIDALLRTLKVRALAQNPKGRFVPGMYVKVQADLTHNDNAIMIPTEAIVPVLRGKKVYVVKEGKVKEIMVTTGLRTDNKIQITDGLQVGDSLVVSGIMALKANTPVKIKTVVGG